MERGGARWRASRRGTERDVAHHLGRHHLQELVEVDRARAIFVDVGDHLLDLFFLRLEPKRAHRDLGWGGVECARRTRRAQGGLRHKRGTVPQGMARRGRESRRWGRWSACLCVSGGGAPRGRDGAMVGALARGAQGAASLGAERAGSSTTCSRLQLLGVDRTCGKRYGGELSGCALGCAEAHRSSSLARRHAAHPSHRCRKGRTPRESPASAPP